MDDDDDEDSDLPDFSALKVSAEEALLFADHANGATYHSFINILLVRVTIPGPSLHVTPVSVWSFYAVSSNSPQKTNCKLSIGVCECECLFLYEAKRVTFLPNGQRH